MRTWITLPCFALLFMTSCAQPGQEIQILPEPDTWSLNAQSSPCGTRMTYEELDLNGDSIMDLSISGTVVGTDDFPSSAGTCTRIVQPLPGSELLIAFENDQPIGPFQMAEGDSLSFGQLTEGLRRQQLIWWPDPIHVVSWSYGNWRNEPSVWSDEQARQTFVLRTDVDGAYQWCWFRIAHDAATDVITVTHGPLVDTAMTLHWIK